MNSRLQTCFTVVSVILLAITWSMPVCGQLQSAIGVTGTGTATAPPDTVELVGIIAQQEELGGDAVTKFAGTKQAALKTFEELGIPGSKFFLRGSPSARIYRAIHGHSPCSGFAGRPPKHRGPRWLCGNY